MATSNSTRTTGIELTDITIRNIKEPGQHADRSVNRLGQLRRGLILKATKTKKVWVYRTKKDGKQLRLTMGEYPETGIAVARELFDELKAADNPTALLAKRNGTEEQSSSVVTVKNLVDRFVREYGKPNKRRSSWMEDERMFYHDLIPRYGKMPAHELSGDMIGDMIDEVLERGSPRSAQKLLVATKTMYNWSMGKERRRGKAVPKKKVTTATRRRKIIPIDANPAEGIAVAEYTPRSCHLDEETLPAFLQNLPKLPIRDDIKDLLMLQLQTVARVTEVGCMRWDEVNMRSKVWTLPAERSKNGQEHRVMLSSQSVEILKRRKKDSEFVFPNKSASGCMNNSLVAEYIAQNREALGVPDAFTSHSLRHTALTWLATHEAEGATRGIRDRLSNHKANTASDMDARYNQHKYDDEAREWLQRWADHLESLA